MSLRNVDRLVKRLGMPGWMTCWASVITCLDKNSQALKMRVASIAEILMVRTIDSLMLYQLGDSDDQQS
jgi:hypothetical protein